MKYSLALLQRLLIQENNGNAQTPQDPNPDFLQKGKLTPSRSTPDQSPKDLGFEPPDFIMDGPENQASELAKEERPKKENNPPRDPDNFKKRKDENLEFSEIDVWKQIQTHQPAPSFFQNSQAWRAKVTRYFQAPLLDSHP